MGDTESYTITSGYIYGEWVDPYTPDILKFTESGFSQLANKMQKHIDIFNFL